MKIILNWLYTLARSIINTEGNIFQAETRNCNQEYSGVR